MGGDNKQLENPFSVVRPTSEPFNYYNDKLKKTTGAPGD
jgi:hypothetical protein